MSTSTRGNLTLYVWRCCSRAYPICRLFYLFEMSLLSFGYLIFVVGGRYYLKGSSNRVDMEKMCINWLLTCLNFSASTTDRHCKCTDDVVTEMCKICLLRMSSLILHVCLQELDSILTSFFFFFLIFVIVTLVVVFSPIFLGGVLYVPLSKSLFMV